jgi:hypothetical protein
MHSEPVTSRTERIHVLCHPELATQGLPISSSDLSPTLRQRINHPTTGSSIDPRPTDPRNIAILIKLEFKGCKTIQSRADPKKYNHIKYHIIHPFWIHPDFIDFATHLQKTIFTPCVCPPVDAEDKQETWISKPSNLEFEGGPPSILPTIQDET